MILVIAGTSDGRELACQLANRGYQLIVSVTTEYGKSLVQSDRILIQDKPLDTSGLVSLIQEKNIRGIVDASHPYAVHISKNALQAAQQTNITYVRYERPMAALPAYDRLYLVDSYEAAASEAAALGKNIFLTTGSRHLTIFAQHAELKQRRLVVRVLPQIQSLEECIAAGIAPKDIVAMQGPFSREFNKAMFIAYGADVVIMKNSGKIGGTDTKLTAAIELGIAVIVIRRPPLEDGSTVSSFAAVMQCLEGVVK